MNCPGCQQPAGFPSAAGRPTCTCPPAPEPPHLDLYWIGYGGPTFRGRYTIDGHRLDGDGPLRLDAKVLNGWADLYDVSPRHAPRACPHR